MKSGTNGHKDAASAYKEHNPLYVEMGKRLRIFRINLDYTQEQMAEILEISPAYYGKVERGIHGLSLEKLVLANKKLDIDINYLLTGNRKEEVSFVEVIKECPRDKRYNMQQLIKYAMKLAKGKDE
ncbi:MAG: helix-turn-helix domain-containing protein [Bacillus sp. (in: Bacteria)]|nr:helix-turn-helix domain-containing protein [Bacillus sp. (in: firmicutes)]MCM1425751.1 helix-turn-helix domain-containing protein [Eubacterium sp.]